MKALKDNFEVKSRIYYYLLDWNEDDNLDYMKKNFSKFKLSELNKFEFLKLMKNAINSDLMHITEKIKTLKENELQNEKQNDKTI